MLRKLALSLSENGKFSYEVNLYLLRSFVHMTGTLILLLILAYTLGIFKWTVIVILTSMILRKFSGGGHSKSKFICSALTLIIPISFAYLTEYLTQFALINQVLIYSLIVFVLGLIAVYKYAPADTPEKPIISLEFKKQLRRNSFIFLIFIQTIITALYVLHYTYFQPITLALLLGLSWQLFTLTPFGYRFIKLLDTLY